MKFINKIAVLCCMAVTFVACHKSMIDPLEGEFDYINQVKATKCVVAKSERVAGNVKALKFDLQDDAANKATVTIYSTEWVLEANAYPVAATKEAGTANVNFNGTEATAGNVTINLVNGVYYVNFLVNSADKTMHMTYSGAMEFVDYGPDPSGIVFTFTSFVDGECSLPHYVISLTENGAELASLQIVSDAEGLTIDNFLGDHAVSGEHAAGNCWSWDYSVYGEALAGGSYLVKDGKNISANTGTLTIESIKAGESTLYTFTLTDWASGETGANGDAGSALFKYCEAAK